MRRPTACTTRAERLRSATSQFYINVVDNRALDHTGESPADFGYAVFGRVLSGMDVVDRIVAVPTTSKNGMDDVPVDAVVIKSVKPMK
jgi:peptidyl-prolyl cis-trans isomerase A (cyclophilin A)